MNKPKTRRTVSDRQPAPVARPQKLAADALIVTDPATLPDRYIVRLEGNCLEPAFPNGTPVVIDKKGKVGPGDFVVLFFKPEHVPAGKHQAILKRVVMAPPPYVKFPFREHPQSDVHALVIVEMTNPPRQFAYKCEHLLGIHKCVGPVPDKERKLLTPVQGAHCGADGPPAFNATKSTFTRRALVAGAVALPALPVAVQSATGRDPILAAIEAHKHAWDELEQALTEADRAGVEDPDVDHLHTRIDDAADGLVDVLPTSMAGVVALLSYAAEFAQGGNIWPTGYKTEHPRTGWDREHGVSWDVILYQNLARALPRITAA